MLTLYCQGSLNASVNFRNPQIFGGLSTQRIACQAFVTKLKNLRNLRNPKNSELREFKKLRKLRISENSEFQKFQKS